jgi:hypothetical protein
MALRANARESGGIFRDDCLDIGAVCEADDCKKVNNDIIFVVVDICERWKAIKGFAYRQVAPCFCAYSV